jgi:polar amino acid transport system permease protein
MGSSLHDWLDFLFNIDLLETWGWRILGGFWITVQTVAISCSLGFVLAYPLCLGRRSQNPVLSKLVLAYVTYFRGTPLLCQLYLVYYGAGEIRPFLTDVGVWWFFREAFYCGIFAFTLNTAAYQSEIIRGALASVPRGQIEAARSLGLSPYRIGRHVVWPQAFLIALRPLGNELVSMIKASALTAIITLPDLMGITRIIFARTFDFSVYLYCALIYLAMTEGVRRLWNRIERFMSRHLALARTGGAFGTTPLAATEAALEKPVIPSASHVG